MGNRLRVYSLVNEIFEEIIEEIKSKNEEEKKNEEPKIKAEINYYQIGAYRGLPTFTSGIVDGLTKREIILKNDGHPAESILLDKIIALDVYFLGEQYPRRVYYKGNVLWKKDEKPS